MPASATHRGILAGLLIILILIGGVGMVHAAQDGSAQQKTDPVPVYSGTSVSPAHPLYGLRLTLENLDESFATTPAERIGRQVDHAGSRIEEARKELGNNQAPAARTALEEYRIKMDETGSLISALPPHKTSLAGAQVQIQDQKNQLEGLTAAHADEPEIRNAYLDCIRIRSLITHAAAAPAVTDSPTASPAEPTATPQMTPSPVPSATAVPSVTATIKPTSPVPTATATQTTPRVTFTPPPARVAPTVDGTPGSNYISLTWTKITDPDLLGYKVVLSKTNPNPKYPDDGYLYWITDSTHNYAVLDSSIPYTGGEINGRLQPGQNYYICINAVYKNEILPGNTLSMTFPGLAAAPSATVPAATLTTTPVVTTASPTPTKTTDTPTPTATTPAPHTIPSSTAQVSGTTVLMNWQRIPDSDFIGYKVVISKSRDNPAYPDDGYMFWITNRETTSATITDTENYNGGDIGGRLNPGTSYAFSITAIYQPWTMVAGNSVRLTFPEPPAPATTAPTPAANATPSASSQGAWLAGTGMPSGYPGTPEQGVPAVM